jgi:hypothetical protein
MLPVDLHLLPSVLLGTVGRGKIVIWLRKANSRVSLFSVALGDYGSELAKANWRREGQYGRARQEDTKRTKAETGQDRIESRGRIKAKGTGRSQQETGIKVKGAGSDKQREQSISKSHPLTIDQTAEKRDKNTGADRSRQGKSTRNPQPPLSPRL